MADLAGDFGFPLLVVSPNVLGCINQTLQTLIAAATYRGGLAVAGVVLNHPAPPPPDDVSSGVEFPGVGRPLRAAGAGRGPLGGRLAEGGSRVVFAGAVSHHDGGQLFPPGCL